MFYKLDLDLDENIFNQLLDSTIFEDITKGRKGTNLLIMNNGIPLVRTTTNYNKPAQIIKPIHKKILDLVIDKFYNQYQKKIDINNIMIELYTQDYRKMGWHTDQTQDLKKDSYICVFSCYEKETQPQDIRKLKIKNKKDNTCSELLLDNNSVVIFSTNTNKDHVHKIVLDSTKPSNNRWIGMTMRFSDTFIEFINNKVFFVESKKELKKANQEDIINIRKYKKEENNNSEFEYPELDFSLSNSDFMEPV